jgi:hypothetical protein
VRTLAIGLLAFAAVSLAGCGAATSESDEPPVFTPGQVVKQFRAETGRSLLRREAVPDEAWEQLGLGLNPPKRLLDTYGVFSIYVVKAGRREAVESLLSNKATGEPLQRGRRGIYWERDTQSRSWIAYKRYGGNVVLAWFGNDGRQAVDGRWERLDIILSRLDAEE